MENGKPQPSLTGTALSLLEDQMELATLELEYEAGYSAKRLVAVLASLFLGLTAFAILQVAIIYGLKLLGLSIPVSCLILAAVYGVGAGVLIGTVGKRDKRAGSPFQGTREELRKNLRWIRQILS